MILALTCPEAALVAAEEEVFSRLHLQVGEKSEVASHLVFGQLLRRLLLVQVVRVLVVLQHRVVVLVCKQPIESDESLSANNQ